MLQIFPLCSCVRERGREREGVHPEGAKEEAVTVFEKIKKTVFFTRLSVFVIVILFPKKKIKSAIPGES